VQLEALDGSIKASFVSYGAAIQSLWVKDKHGAFRDIVLGYDNITQYVTDGPSGQSHPYFGPIVGRYANRIKNGTFSIPISKDPTPGPHTFHVVENENNGTDTLHGGEIGYDHRYWIIKKQSKSSVSFHLFDPDGFQGFPGSVSTHVTYTLENNAKWNIRIKAFANDLTPIMLSSHVYWNMEAYQESTNLLQHRAEFKASRIIATDSILIPTGNFTAVHNTAADFYEQKSLGQAIEQTKSGEFCGADCTGFDNCWIYNEPSNVKEPKISIWSANSGIRLDVKTDQPALQVYTCNGVSNPVPIPRKRSQGGPSSTYSDHSCLVIEQESYIDAINNPDFHINQIYGPSRPYSWESTYQFSVVS